ncbi:MAG: hypothetical protein M2R45_02779 [Verrucomicrobia subdivision 3 bacterium]|nr:hypothetical protein [Limisphaerales bacterium]MCS1414329.1 hypothetical protein [Limisphaerales bacterium]
MPTLVMLNTTGTFSIPWLADSDKPTPLVIYIHGGGFRGGNKNSLNAQTLKQLLQSKISVPRSITV